MHLVCRKTRHWLFTAVLMVCLGVLAGCGGSQSSGPSAAEKAQIANEALQKEVHQSVHNVEFRNYNKRQVISDNPATILWCTFFPPGQQNITNGSTGGQAFTIPIAGKLTSSGKRPYSGTLYNDLGSNESWQPEERPGPDHMYGPSVEYRYGFDPTLTTYYDFTALASFCTTEPTVWQTRSTQIVVKTEPAMTNLSKAAEQSIKSGNPKEALNLLKQAETYSETQKGK